MREIGFADVDVVRNEREARFVDQASFIPLVNGHTLRIKFRIDRPVADADRDGVYNRNHNCRDVANRSSRTLAHATATCTAGACGVASCGAGYANCDGNASNGCETATNTLTNRGACNNALPLGVLVRAPVRLVRSALLHRRICL